MITKVFAAVLGVACGAGALLAQENLLPLPLENSTVLSALEKSKREHRVLVVVREWKRPPQGRRPWWVNDSVRAWLSWHAVLVELKADDVEGRQYLRGVPADDANIFWGIDVFIDGKHVRLLGCANFFLPNPFCPNCSPEAARGPEDVADSGKPCISPTATSILFQLDFQRACAVERAPIWAQLHQIDCPEPKRPGRLYWYGQAKDGIPSVPDAATPEAGARYVDVMARLLKADAGLPPQERAALLTWAWERGGEVDPAFALARIGLVLPRLIQLGRADAGIQARLLKIADAELALYPWLDDHEEVGYLCLRKASGGAADAVVRLVIENVDLDEETMGAIVASRLGDLKARITQQDGERPVSPEQWKAFARAANAPLPRTIDNEPRTRWNRVSVELLTIGAVRSYALLLASGSPADRQRAEEIAADVLGKAKGASPELRARVLRAMVFAAASVGKADSTHAGWLGEAARLDPPAGQLVDPLTAVIGSSGR